VALQSRSGDFSFDERYVRNVFVLSWLSSAKTVEEGTRKGPNIKLTESLRHRPASKVVVVFNFSKPAISVHYLKLNTPLSLEPYIFHFNIQKHSYISLYENLSYARRK
jgi:hypothetical protein